MPKSPAINWYFDNWGGGTKTMSRHLKGCYMDLLDAQFQNGHLSLDEIKHVLGSDFSAWQTLQKKFDKDAHGNYFNERLDIEIKKRDESSKKQSERVKKRWEKYHGTYHGITTVIPVNDTESESINKEGSERKFEPQKIEFMDIPTSDFKNYSIDQLKWSYLNGPTHQATREAICMNRRLTVQDLEKKCQEFVMSCKESGKHQTNMTDFVKHFRNWISLQKDQPVKSPKTVKI